MLLLIINAFVMEVKHVLILIQQIFLFLPNQVKYLQVVNHPQMFSLLIAPQMAIENSSSLSVRHWEVQLEQKYTFFLS